MATKTVAPARLSRIPPITYSAWDYQKLKNKLEKAQQDKKLVSKSEWVFQMREKKLRDYLKKDTDGPYCMCAKCVMGRKIRQILDWMPELKDSNS